MVLKSFTLNNSIYYQLYIVCPVCIENNIETQPSPVYHSNDGCNGDIYLGNNGYFYCDKCNAKINVRNVRFICTHEKEEAGVIYLKEIKLAAGNLMNLAHSISISKQLIDSCGLAWFESVLHSFEKTM